MSSNRVDEVLTFPAWPQHGPEERAGLLRALDQEGWWRNGGSEVDSFEEEFAALHGAPRALATTNGTHALELALSVLGVGPGDEVLVPSFTFISCSLAVQRTGAVPVPVDVRPDTYCLDVDAAARVITPRTKVVMPVHLAGQFADMDALAELSSATGVTVLQDAAHAHAARWRGRRVGELGSIAAFSFQNGKLMTAGEGGALLLPDEESYQEAYLRHGCGRPPKDRLYEHRTQGSNYRMTEFSAAVLRAQLSRLEEQVAVREERSRHLMAALARIPGVVPQGRDERGDVKSHYMAMVRLPGTTAERRLALVDRLISHGVPAFVAFPPVYRTSGFWEGPHTGDVDDLAKRCPVAEEIGNDCLWLHHRVLLADTPVLDRLAEVFASAVAAG
ncbi:aminotransferase class I/II-fold pyridoxal phosphate-dependent enzyme [Streptomyces sp. NPDC001812]|uniref:Aminotransferase class I/II-fold pyridoxal phosphate-dependent enzyme n=1 Tax=Streptomyces cathayae TaxID=3031124 RepID=A0ABY8K0G6_9ACTN|nr:aminotransferase class I/II-fold pyridoxal phosphate-dependent enzyme [Streptomyces sp. HUAS 5]WGD40994.1 aminotransferase class I/II-fold pyridoxal phosphate-dependent enzyme [Streptomyces sp. HUAS 5]